MTLDCRPIIASRWLRVAAAVWTATALGTGLKAQLVDRTLAPNRANAGIARSLDDQLWPGRGDVITEGSSRYLIARDPFRAIRRGRELFQRKFTFVQGLGPRTGDGAGDIETNVAIGAGLADSCAGCHGRPRGAAGIGGDVATRPDSRDAMHLFGLGLKEMLADEMTADLRAARRSAAAQAARTGKAVEITLKAKGVDFGRLSVWPNGVVDASRVDGVDADLRVRPFFAHGGTVSIREFIVGALNAEMGLTVADPATAEAAAGGRVVTPAGMILDGASDTLEAPPAGPSEMDAAAVDYLEFYLLNYFKPGRGEQTAGARFGREIFGRIGCARCHVPNLPLRRDRRVADVEVAFDPDRGILNRLFAVATPLYRSVGDRPGAPPLKSPVGGPFLVRDIFTDFKRHDLGPAFHERNYDGTLRTHFLTSPLWGVGSTAPYGHDGRSISLTEVILRHGGEAAEPRDAFAELASPLQRDVVDFLNSLILFPPDDTASNLDPGDRAAAGFPQFGHGSIRLSVLFNDPTVIE